MNRKSCRLQVVSCRLKSAGRGFGEGAAESGEDPADQLGGERGLVGLVVERCAKVAPHLAERERDGRAIGGARGDGWDDDIDQIAHGCATGLQDEFCDQRVGNRAGVEVRAALEAVRCVGVQTVASRTAADAGGVEPRGLDQNVFGVGGNHGVPAAHNSGQAKRLGVVGDDKIVGFQRAFRTIEQLEPLALAREADDDSAVDLVEIKRVGGMAHPLQNKVGGIDRVGDGFRSQQREVLGYLA